MEGEECDDATAVLGLAEDPKETEAPEPEPEPQGLDAIAALDAEPEAITKWKAERDSRKKKIEEEEKQNDAELEKKAAEELEKWKSEYEAGITSRATNNKSDEEAFIEKRDETGPGNQWERVAFLLDLASTKEKGRKDTGRMKSMLIQLKTTGLVRD
eukprot:m.19122 g.19122  ORF g.19122 m.19122 type:complete len:157 (-) comp6490_c0_seq1:1041-1511(-)